MLTTEEMKKLEDLSEKHGVSKLKLMENAGQGLFAELKKRFDLENKKILVICGSGNNGGDGFVAAKYLYREGFDVNVLFLGKEDKLKKESGFNYYRLREICNEIFYKEEKYENIISSSDIIIDAMLGTGVAGRIRKPYSSVIDLINNSKARVISVDIPTGLNPDTGEIHDKMCRFDLIITFHDIKPGLEKYKKDVVIVDIGIITS
ncbi:NAD(P)H-hydrate epimerase [Candidatus Woesearchaeota archaeon]|nr:NAD(P)H-hydrate epimerase [Candidatus Woesearchaeota archaeon]